MTKLLLAVEADKSKDYHYALDGDGGLPLYVQEDVVLPAWERVYISHGQAYQFEAGVHALVIPRSSSFRNRQLTVDVGFIDHNYRGFIGTVVTFAPSPWEVLQQAYEVFAQAYSEGHGVVLSFRKTLQALKKPSLTLKRGDRISQLVMFPVVTPSKSEFVVQESGELQASARGTNGFGHTGQ